MAINHFGLSQSYLHEASGRAGFLISAAEAFLFISGFTLGFITIGRTPEQATTRLAARTWTVYLATVGISLGLGLVALTTHFQLWGELEAGSFAGVWAWIGQVLVLRTAFNGADILIAYVLYLAVAIGALRLMTAGRSWGVVAATVGAYTLSQLAPTESVTFGFASFRALLPNTPLFFGGLVIGYHRHRIAAAWNAVPFRRALDGVIVAVGIGLAWLHSDDWAGWEWLGERVAGPERTEPLGLREVEMPVVPLLIVFLYLRIAWLIADLLWRPLRRSLGWFLLPLGAASLFPFTMRLVAVPIESTLPWWPDDDIGRWAATGWVVLYLAVIYGAVLCRRRVLDWLRAGGSGRERIRRHGPLATVGLLLVAVLLVSPSSAGAAGSFGSGDGGFDEEFDDEFDEEVGGEFEGIDEELWVTVGTQIDRYVAGEGSADDVLALLPAATDPGRRSEIAAMLADDPWSAEEAIVLLIAGSDEPADE